MTTPPRPARSAHLPRTLAVCMPFVIACASPQKPVPPATAHQPAIAPAAAQESAAPNPFLADSPLPLHYPPFDRIRDSDYEPAFEAGMAEHLKEVQAIAHDPAPPTFENT